MLPIPSDDSFEFCMDHDRLAWRFVAVLGSGSKQDPRSAVMAGAFAVVLFRRGAVFR